MASVDIGQINALDPNSLSGLRRLSKDSSPEATREAARQFEALFVQQMLKAMRDATPKNSLTDSDETRMYQSLLDQQLSMQLATRGGGIGLAKVIERQLNPAGATPPNDPLPLEAAIKRDFDNARLPALPSAKTAAKTAAPVEMLPAQAASSAALAMPNLLPGAGPRAFVDRVWPEAVEASRATGIPAHFLIAQAALETGWGKKELKHADGSPSFNLFNIKAGKRWSGESVATATTEYVGGAPVRENARFRAYGSYREAFQDYANLIRNNPRYAALVGENDPHAFARGLQSAGYATDPAYASKLSRIISGSTLRVALAAGATPPTA